MLPHPFSASTLYRPPRDFQFHEYNFVILRLITKFKKTLCHENLELNGISKIDYKIWFSYNQHPIHCILNYTALHELCISRMACDNTSTRLLLLTCTIPLGKLAERSLAALILGLLKLPSPASGTDREMEGGLVLSSGVAGSLVEEELLEWCGRRRENVGVKRVEGVGEVVGLGDGDGTGTANVLLGDPVT